MATAISRISQNSGKAASLSVYILDDDLDFAQSLQAAVRHFGHSAVVSSDPEFVLDSIRRKRCDVAIADIRMPAMGGLELLSRAQSLDCQVPVIMMTGFYSIDSAIEAIKLGAHDYLQKPFNLPRLRTVLDEIQKRQNSVQDHRTGIDALRSHGFVGQSRGLLATFDLARRVAPHFENVLLTGPTGTGKELLAKAIHAMSPVSKQRISLYNCSTLVETLAESLLFGHERGAFTGAIESRPGLFEAAAGGTVMLDEIGEIPLSMQAKLLRIVQSREVQRLGSTEVHRVNVRLIAATNRDLRAEVEAGRFREDLFYRLSAIELRLPALRERMDDLPSLVKHFCRVYGDRYGKSVRGVSREVQHLLKRYHWPGNVRELENVISYGCMMAEHEVVGVCDLPGNIDFSGEGTGDVQGAPRTLDEVCERYVKQMMERFGGDALQTARALNIGKTTIYRYMKRGNV